MKKDYERQKNILPPFLSKLNKVHIEEKVAYDIDNEEETKIEVRVEDEIKTGERPKLI